MPIKPYYILGCLGLGISIPSAHALNCNFVAQIHLTKGLEEVRIQRAESGKKEQASPHNRELCRSDVVFVPDIPELKILYVLDKPATYRTLKPGVQYWVSCGGSDIWCKFLEFVMNFRTSPYKGGTDNAIFMPLAADEGLEYPFYLFAGKGKGVIPLFWYKGQTPYQLTVTDATGKVVVREKTEVADFTLTLPNTAPGSEYTLMIQSSDEQSLGKKLVFVEPPSLKHRQNQEMMPAELFVLTACEDEKNWRLEVWRQLSALPDSEHKKNFMDHLRADDVDPYEFDLCQ